MPGVGGEIVIPCPDKKILLDYEYPLTDIDGLKLDISWEGKVNKNGLLLLNLPKFRAKPSLNQFISWNINCQKSLIMTLKFNLNLIIGLIKEFIPKYLYD